MKYQHLFVAAVLLSVALTGCTPAEQPAEEPVPEEPAEPAFDVTTFAPIQYMWMYDEIAPVEGTRYFRINKTAGIDRAEPLTSNGIEVTGKLEGTDREFTGYEVERKDGSRLFMSSSFFVPNAQLGAVVGDETVLYTEASRLEPSSHILPRKTLVVIPKDDKESEGNGFYQVTGWDDERSVGISKQYVLKDQVSLKEADVESLIFLLKAEESTNDVQKKALLTSAEEYTDSAFIEEIDEALYELVGAPEEAAAPTGADREVYSFAAFGVINAQDAKVFDKPDEASAVIGTVSMGQQVTLMERTAQEFTYEPSGETGYWYKISNPEGWVFGSFIDLE